MMLFLWIFVALLWTIVIFLFGIYVGHHMDDEEKTEVTNAFHQANNPLTDDDRYRLQSVAEMQDRILRLEKVPMPEQGPPGPPGPAADVLGTELPNGMTLGEWVTAADARFTRVERRAGMSV